MGSRAAPEAPVLLRPALAAAGRMRTSLRLGTLVMVLMVPGIVATWGYLAEERSKIAFSAREADGADLLEPALVAMADAVAGRQPDLAAVRDAAGRHAELKLDVAVPDGADRVATTRALGDLITQIGENSNLILDPDLDSFSVIDAQVVQLPSALLAAAESVGGGSTAEQAVHAGALSSAAERLRADVSTALETTAMVDLGTRLAPVVRAADTLAALATTMTAALAQPQNPGPAAEVTRAAVSPLAGVLRDLLATRIDEFTDARRIMLTVTIGGFVLAAWFAVAVLWRTRHDVTLAVTGVTAIASGDLSVRPLPAGRDELGDIGKALDSARARLVQQDTALNQAQSVREEQLRISFLHQRQAELRLRDRAQSIIDESTSIIAEELREVTAQVGDVRQASETIDQEISAADAATSAVVDHARRAEEVIASLEQSLHRVAATAQLVQGIAGQTRLLALNATIEAARAGELGLGFTVVADEVKELATTTSRSTEQIAETIQELERDTAEMTGTISAMVTGIGSVGDAAMSLRATAADQGAVVGRLADRMGYTIERVEQMSGLAAQLERRQSDRVAAAGTVELRLAGSEEPVPATLINLSAGGLRVQLEPATAARVVDGDVVDIKLGPERIAVPARAANRDGDQIGLQFLITSESLAARVDDYLNELLT